MIAEAPDSRAQTSAATDAVAPADADHLGWLESEAIHILREVAGQCHNPALLFSGGKDSLVLLRLAEKAFRPGRFPFPLLHIDTGHNFPEVISFRDARAAELGETLIVRTLDESIAKGRIVLKSATQSRNAFQSVTLLDTIEEFRFDALIGGARRDEEKARAKERIFSFRDAHAWSRAQRVARRSQRLRLRHVSHGPDRAHREKRRRDRRLGRDIDGRPAWHRDGGAATNACREARRQ